MLGTWCNFWKYLQEKVKLWNTGGRMHLSVTDGKVESEMKVNISIFVFQLNAVYPFCTTRHGWGVLVFFFDINNKLWPSFFGANMTYMLYAYMLYVPTYYLIILMGSYNFFVCLFKTKPKQWTFVLLPFFWFS